MWESYFCSHGRPSTTGYWPNLMTNSLMTLRCVLRAKTMRTVCVIAPEKTILPSATVRLQGCCIGINFNLCSCANKELMNNAVAPQSAMAIVLNEVFLLAIMHDKTMWSHCFFVLAMSTLVEINNPNPVSPRERLCSRTACFLTVMLLSSRGYQPHGA